MNEDMKSAWSLPVRFALGVGLAFCLLGEARAQSLLTTNGQFFAWPDSEVPGHPGLYLGGTLEFPTAAEDGTFLFRSDLYGAGTSGANFRALFTASGPLNLAMLARWSDPAPGLPGVSLRNAAGTQGIGSSALISPSGGYSLWSSVLSGAGVGANNDTALFGSSPGGSFLIAQEGGAAPGTAGAVYSSNLDASYQYTAINRHGSVMFSSLLSGGDVVGTTNNGALFSGLPGALSIVRRLGDTVLPGPVKVSGIGYVQQMDNDGRVIYDAQLSGTGVTGANNYSLWFYTPGSGSTLLLREGDPAPGTAGAVFGNPANNWYPGMSSTALTRNGKYEFTSDLIGGDVIPGLNDRALFAGSASGGVTLVARGGQPAPGTDSYFWGFSPYYSLINEAGDVAFQATLNGGTVDPTNNSGIWIKRNGTISLVVRSGAPVAGMPGTTYDTFIGWNMVFNDLGQIIVHGNLLGGDVVPGLDDRILLAWDPVKGLFNLARNGEQIEGVPGDIRTTRLFTYIQYNNTDGNPHGLGKNGKAALMVYFYDGNAMATVDLNCYPAVKYGLDVDGDGYGNPLTAVSVCNGTTPPSGYIPNATDCDDANPAVFAAYYHDADGDGYGDPSAGICDDLTPPAGYVTKKTDCDDTNPAVHPGLSDANCDGLDNNCNGSIDEYFVSPSPTTCGLGACASSGEANCVDGVLYDTCTPGTPSAETCNGIDDNCDGTVDNPAAPSGTSAVVLQNLGGGAARLNWSAVPTATKYDLVRGSLQGLKSSGGDFSVATTDCLGDDLLVTTADDGTVPAANQGLFYLIRAANCGASGSYNSGAPSQAGSRDAEIAASGHACP